MKLPLSSIASVALPAIIAHARLDFQAAGYNNGRLLLAKDTLMATPTPRPRREARRRQRRRRCRRRTSYDSALGRWRHVLFGRPLPTSRADEQKLPNFMALPILSSNALSSNAYATEAILGVLILAKSGAGAFHYAVPIALAICALLIVVTLSYIQVIYAYPEGGGAYPVSRDNLGPVPSLVAGASLMVDYLLTVAVSVAAGVAALIAMFAGNAAGVFLQDHIVAVCLICILALTLANLRGLREAGALFAVPTYVFIAAIVATVIAGLYAMGAHPAYAHAALHEGQANALKGAQAGAQAVGLILILQAFSQGCAALTGMEAISSTVPIFQKPSDKNAVLTMYIMSGLAVVMFAGLTYVADGLGTPGHGRQQARLPERGQHRRRPRLAARPALGLLRGPDLDGHRAAAGGQHRLRGLPAAHLHDGPRRLPAPPARQHRRPAFLLQRHRHPGLRGERADHHLPRAGGRPAADVRHRRLHRLHPGADGHGAALAAPADAGVADQPVLQCPGSSGDRHRGRHHRRLQVRQRRPRSARTSTSARCIRITASGSC